jgi:hypothetical protein
MPARVLWSAGLLWLAASVPAWGQAPDIIYVRQPSFRIPFQIDPAEQARLREVQLLLSEDHGQTWRYHASVGPDQRFFPFRAERDGLYLFMVRTKDVDGRLFPPSLDGARPGLRVMVDTQLPVVALRPLVPRAEQVGVEWEVRDDNTDLDSLQLEYRAQHGGDWLPLRAEPQAVGQKYWTPSVRGPLEVRLRVRDRADNQGSALLFLPAAGAPPSPSTPGEPPPPVRPAPSGSSMKVVGSTEINLNYDLQDVGPSGVSVVELWFTRDGRSWQRYGEDPDKTSPFLMKVPGEGVYGLTLVVRSGVGLGDRPPQLGDPPQLWIEVDLTRPAVQVISAQAGRGADAGTLTVTWTATDKNLTPQPISLFYAEQPDGPWNPIATALDNTGRYVWRVPPAAPPQFYVRVEAIDRGGNIGRSDTAKPVIIDLSQPKGRLLGVDVVPK